MDSKAVAGAKAPASNPAASLFHKCRELIKLLNVQLAHFPRHERYALCQQIREAAYDVYGLLVECRKKHHNRTSLARLDIRHEQLRMLVNLAYELGYFDYHHNKRGRSQAEALRRYTSVSVLINELGAMLGGWIRRVRAPNGAGH